MSEHLTPAEVVEHMIGRPEVIGAAIGVNSKTAYNWRRPAHSRDAGDIPSPRHMRSLLAYAAARRIPLTSDHLIWGAKRAEVEALLSQMPAPQPVRAAE
jgi:hypothetical protein